LAKKGAKQAVLETDTLTLDYTLAELSSSQHRSGLAGLVLMVRWLHRFEHWKQDGSAICEIDNLSDRGATLRINQLGLQALLYEVYAASWEEKTEYKLREDKETGEIIQPIRTEEVPDKDSKTGKVKIDKKTGQPKTKTAYYYPMFVPKGAFLVDPQYDRSSDGKNGLWIKLWRDALWAILKAKALSRNSFKARANELSDTKDVKDIWKNLANPSSKVKLAGSFYLGVQEKNAEDIPFKDRGRYQFLLHFWFFVAQIYVPIKINIEKDKESKNIQENIDFWGYVIAIPDIANLKLFCDEFFEFLSSREIKPFKFLPRECIIDLQLEAALEMSKRLELQLNKSESKKSMSDLVNGIDIIHAHRPKDDTKFIYIRRFLPTMEMANEYEVIKNSLWSPTFRHQRLLNLVRDKKWYTGFDSLLCTIPYEQTMENDYFRHDSRESFKYEVGDMTEETLEIPEESDLPEYSRQKLILRLVRTYVTRKLNTKHGLEWKSEWTNLRKTKEGREKLDKLRDYQEFNEKKAKIAKSAFLDIRSRTETSEFINYFACTICSVPQYMKEEHFVQLTQDLYEKTDEVRTITLLALSANS
jgi:CRISPR-associated protein Cmx8